MSDGRRGRGGDTVWGRLGVVPRWGHGGSPRRSAAWRGVARGEGGNLRRRLGRRRGWTVGEGTVGAQAGRRRAGAGRKGASGDGTGPGGAGPLHSPRGPRAPPARPPAPNSGAAARPAGPPGSGAGGGRPTPRGSPGRRRPRGAPCRRGTAPRAGGGDGGGPGPRPEERAWRCANRRVCRGLDRPAAGVVGREAA